MPSLAEPTLSAEQVVPTPPQVPAPDDDNARGPDFSLFNIRSLFRV
jgi:hypothetical protein